jgi:hypothetical protein
MSSNLQPTQANLTIYVMTSSSYFSCACEIWSPESVGQDEYQYVPLQDGQDVSRFEARTGSSKDTLLCSLEPLAFNSDHEKYEALSYTWGDGCKTHKIVTPSQSRLGLHQIFMQHSITEEMTRWRYLSGSMPFVSTKRAFWNIINRS